MISENEFKKALGSFISGITIVSSINEEKASAITISSFCSLSLNPPMILYCLDKSSHRFSHFSKSKNFAVSILSHEQQIISDHFARDIKNIWQGIDHDLSKIYSIPIVKNCLYYLECEQEKILDGGDHVIITAKVISTVKGSFDKPLIYYRGEYNS